MKQNFKNIYLRLDSKRFKNTFFFSAKIYQLLVRKFMRPLFKLKMSVDRFLLQTAKIGLAYRCIFIFSQDTLM